MLWPFAIYLTAGLTTTILFIPAIIAVKSDHPGLRADRLTYGRWLIIFGLLAFVALLGGQWYGALNRVGWANVDWSQVNIPILVLGTVATFIMFPFAGWFFPRVIMRRVKDARWPGWLAYAAVIVPVINTLLWFVLLLPETKFDNDENGREAC